MGGRYAIRSLFLPRTALGWGGIPVQSQCTAVEGRSVGFGTGIAVIFCQLQSLAQPASLTPTFFDFLLTRILCLVSKCG